MRRTLTFVAASALLLGACGSDDSADSSATTVTDSATTTVATTTEPASTAEPATTTTVDPALCFDASAPVDPAEHPEGEVPTAVRPCELPTELVTTVLRPGTGYAAAAGDQLIMDYVGVRSANGEHFDDSYSRSTPFNFVLGTGRVIAGWDEGLVGVQAGELIRLDIPSDLAYGDTPRGDIIQAGDALTFLVEARAVVRATTEADAPLDLVVDTSEGATEVTTRDVTVGDGSEAQTGQTALAHIMLVRGDNRVILLETWSSGQAAEIPLIDGSPSLPGLVTGIEGMRVGGTRVITMPPSEAYGDAGETSLGLPGDVDLIAVVELMGVYETPSATS